MSTSKKVSQLNELVTPANDDVLAIVDTSATETKRITVANLLALAGSGSVETPPQTPNGVATQFTVTAQPRYIVADGLLLFEGAGYSYNSGTDLITLDNPPVYFIRAFI